MQTYHIETAEKVINTYSVDAKSEAEVRALVLAGEVDADDYESVDQEIIACDLVTE